jgi:3-isopropylmalate dehydrogenase
MSTQTYRILLLPGDGVGPEVIDEAVATLDVVAARSGFTIAYARAHIGGAAVDAHGVPLRPEDAELATQVDGVLLGAVGGPQWERQPRELRPEAGLLSIRRTLGLFANLRPVKVFDALADASPVKPEITRGVDLLIVRELTGGLYFGKPSKVWNTARGRRAVDTLAYREQEIERLVRLGFEQARARRGKLTSVDKSNVLASSQLWRTIVSEVAADYADVTLEHALVDSSAMTLITRPRDFDVLVMENTFGDILSDEAAVLAGSLGMLPSASLSGRRLRHGGLFGLYEPIHGSAPDIAGQGVANPSGAILSAAMLMRTSLGRDAEATAIEGAVEAALQSGARTRDIAGGGPALTTAEFGARVRAELEHG